MPLQLFQHFDCLLCFISVDPLLAQGYTRHNRGHPGYFLWEQRSWYDHWAVARHMVYRKRHGVQRCREWAEK